MVLCGWTNIAAPGVTDAPYHTRSRILTDISSFEFEMEGLERSREEHLRHSPEVRAPASDDLARAADVVED